MSHSMNRNKILRLESLDTRVMPAFLSSSFKVIASTAIVAPVPTPVPALVSLNAVQKARANKLISTFENSTPTLQYGYGENLNDGRGYTVGRAGFTTANGDALLCVERITSLVPTIRLAKYLPRLRELAAQESGSTTGLDGFVADWKLASNDRRFRAVQDQVSDQLYYQPAVLAARNIGVKNALTLVAIYDTAIQHGNGTDPDSMNAIIARTNALSGGTPKSGIAEKTWLTKFLNERERTLLNPTNTDTASAWAESVDRVRAIRSFATANNITFAGRLRYSVYGDPFVVT
jgi:chitosanase